MDAFRGLCSAWANAPLSRESLVPGNPPAVTLDGAAARPHQVAAQPVTDRNSLAERFAADRTCPTGDLSQVVRYPTTLSRDRATVKRDLEFVFG
jgi:hypothetical protein